MTDNTSYDTTTTMDAAAFINTIGVDTHVSTGANGYSSVTNVVDDLAYLGVANVRDGDNGSFSSLETMAAAGIKFDFLMAGGGTITSTTLSTEFGVIDALNEAYPGSVVAVEGANEINNFPISYNGDTGSTAAVALQEAIYSDTKADTNLPGVNVIYFTGYGLDGGPNPNPATTSGLADLDNAHSYPLNSAPPMQYLNRPATFSNESPATGPGVYTEVGYSNTGTFNDPSLGNYGKAVYTVDALLDSAVQGISTTYLYELMEEGDGLGLFDTSNNPTEAATAIHNLTSILSDSGTVTTTGANYTVQNLPSDGNSMRMLKSNGDTDIVVWAEPQVSQYATPITTPVTVSLDHSYATVKVYDPMSGTSPIETLSNVSSVTLDVTDHPLIIEVDPTQSTSGTVSSDFTTVYAGSSQTLTDSAGTVWGIDAANSDVVTMNGADLTTPAAAAVAMVQGQMWAEEADSSTWFSFNETSGGGWSFGGGTQTSPLISAPGTTILAGDSDSKIVDSTGNYWSLDGSNKLLFNGSGYTGGPEPDISEIAFVNNQAWAQQTSNGSWYALSESGGSPVVSTTASTTPFESPDETEIIAGNTTSSITDVSGNVWALNSSDYLTLNGAADTSFVQQEVAYVDQTIWVQTGGNWYSLATTDGTLATLTVTGANGTTSPVGPSDGPGAMAMVHTSVISSSLSQTAATPQLIHGSPAPAPAAAPAPTLSSVIASSHSAHDVVGSMGLPVTPTPGAAAMHAADPTVPAGGFAHFVPDTAHPVMAAH
jgi:hypothetical protein